MKAARCYHQAACLAINYRSSSYVTIFTIIRHSAIHLKIYHSRLPLSRIFHCFFLEFFSCLWFITNQNKMTKKITKKPWQPGFRKVKSVNCLYNKIANFLSIPYQYNSGLPDKVEKWQITNNGKEKMIQWKKHPLNRYLPAALPTGY